MYISLSKCFHTCEAFGIWRVDTTGLKDGASHATLMGEALRSMIVIVLVFAVGGLLAVTFVGGLNENRR